MNNGNNNDAVLVVADQSFSALLAICECTTRSYLGGNLMDSTVHKLTVPVKRQMIKSTSGDSSVGRASD